MFVDRVITAIVLQSLLGELLPRYTVGWKTKYIAGNNSGLQSQSRKLQNEIVEEFREGKVCVVWPWIYNMCFVLFFYWRVETTTLLVFENRNIKFSLQVNIIVATSILEEGLDVQSCNLVVRFDPSATVSSFIQSRGRARMQNSDYLLMVKR